MEAAARLWYFMKQDMSINNVLYANDGKSPVDIEIDVGANEVLICR